MKEVADYSLGGIQGELYLSGTAAEWRGSTPCEQIQSVDPDSTEHAGTHGRSYSISIRTSSDSGTRWLKIHL